MVASDPAIILLYLAIGTLSGLVAGLFGLGGGIIIVPALLLLFDLIAFPDNIQMKMAVSSALAIIIFTSVSSIRSHHKRGAIQWKLVYRIILPIAFGAYLGTLLVHHLSGKVLQIGFGIYLSLVALQILLHWKPHTDGHATNITIQESTISAIVIGSLSSLLGIGGGTLSVPWLLHRNFTIHQAIATAAAIGLPIAVFACISQLITPVTEPTPTYSLGYIYLPAVLLIAVSSIFTAPIGARLAHNSSKDILEISFALILLVISLKMVT